MAGKISIASRRQEIQQRTALEVFGGTCPVEVPLRLAKRTRTGPPPRPFPNPVVPLTIALPTTHAELLESIASGKTQGEMPIKASVRRESSLLILNLQRTEPDKHLIPTEKVAEILALSRSNVYRLVHKGLLPSYRIGRVLRFDPQDVLKFLAGCLENPGGTPCI